MRIALTLLALLLLPMGCTRGNDTASPTSGDADTDTDTDTDADSDSDADSDADSDTDSDTDTDTDTDTDPCQDVACSDHGTCVEVAGEATCDCDDDYLADGLLCESCPVIDPSAFDVDVPTITLTGELSVQNGSHLDGDNYGAIWLTTDDGDSAELGLTYYTDYEIRLIAGTYDIYYRVSQSNGTAPENTWALLEEGRLLAADTTLDIEVPTITLSGELSIEGGSHLDGNNYGRIVLVNDTGDSAELGLTYYENYEILLIAGTYDVYYQSVQANGTAPPNQWALLDKRLVLSADRTLNIVVPTITVTGELSTEGGSHLDGDNYGAIWLTTDDGDSAELGLTYYTDYESLLVAGTYDIFYAVGQANGFAPENTWATVDVGVQLENDRTLNITVPTVTVSGELSIGGGVHLDGNNYGAIWLTTDDGDSAELGLTYYENYEVQLVTGTYDVYYRATQTNGLAPENAWALLDEALILGGDRTLDVTVPTVRITGELSTEGGSHLDGNNYGSIWLTNDAGDSAELGLTYYESYDVLLVAGTYDVYYQATQTNGTVPENTWALLDEGRTLTTDTTLDVTVPSSRLTGTLSTQGGTHLDGNNYGAIWLSTDSGDSAELGLTYYTDYTTRLVPGVYGVYYQGSQTNGTAPENAWALVQECVQIP
jgi:hypothetical protein